MRIFLILSLLYINIFAKEITPVVFASEFTNELARIKKDPKYLVSKKQLQKYIKKHSDVFILYQDISFTVGDFKEMFLTGTSSKKIKRNFVIYFIQSKVFKRYPLELRLKLLNSAKQIIKKEYWEEAFILYNIIGTEYTWSDKIKDIKKQIEALKFLLKNYEKYKYLYIYNKGDVKTHAQPDMYGESYIDMMKFDLEHNDDKNSDILLKEYAQLIRELYTKSRKDITHYDKENIKKVLKDQRSKRVHNYFKEKLEEYDK